ncbi:MAG: outer membrane lipoprotein-sorting protein [Spirochaetota bacterium]
MKQSFIFIPFLICVTLTPVALISQEKRTVELSAQEILARADEVLRYPLGLLTGSITHIYPDGRSFNVMMKGSISDDDFLFVVGTADRGDQFKVLFNLGGEDIWVYNINAIQLYHKIDIDKYDSVMNSNFSFLDISNADLQSSYIAKIEGDAIIRGKECYKMSLDPIFRKGEYGKLGLYVSKTDYIPLKIEYYDQDKVIIKSMSISQTADFGGRIFPVRYDMLHVKSGTLSILKFFGVDTKVSFNKEIFRHQTLGQ